ncbi:hypothetical protein BDFB_013182, partial [Asbolus verrucosus]
KEILTSKPVWATVVASTSAIFRIFIILNQLPSYMAQVLHFSIEEIGLLSSLPHLVRYVVSTIACYVADKLRKTEKLSITTVRKLFTIASLGGGFLLFSLQAFWGTNSVISIIIFTGFFFWKAFDSAGFHSNSLDISPAYAGTIYELTNVFASAAGYVSTKIVALFIKERQNFEQWRYIFWIMVVIKRGTISEDNIDN